MLTEQKSNSNSTELFTQNLNETTLHLHQGTHKNSEHEVDLTGVNKLQISSDGQSLQALQQEIHNSKESATGEFSRF
jgi:hypothetical protein